MQNDIRHIQNPVFQRVPTTKKIPIPVPHLRQQPIVRNLPVPIARLNKPSFQKIITIEVPKKKRGYRGRRGMIDPHTHLSENLDH